MPSSIITQVAEIKDIRKHSDPEVERLEVATINGWQIVCGKGSYKEGDKLVYITPDSLIPESLADRLNIKNYLNTVRNADGSDVKHNDQLMYRVKQVKLRGEPSFGTTIPREVVLELTGIDIEKSELGTNLAENLGIIKYEPAMRSTAGDAEAEHALFPKYTSIENLRNFPKLFEDGEKVYLTQKIHGTNCRVGLIEGQWMAGSHGVRRKEPEDYSKNTYWFPLSIPEVRNLLHGVSELFNTDQVVLYGEVYGNVQKKYNYGVPNGIAFRAFDILVAGRYLPYDTFLELTSRYDVPAVLALDFIDYSFETVVERAERWETDPIGLTHPLEGVVVRPLQERTDHRTGRVILKYITTKYLFDKGGSDFKDE